MTAGQEQAVTFWSSLQLPLRPPQRTTLTLLSLLEDGLPVSLRLALQSQTQGTPLCQSLKCQGVATGSVMHTLTRLQEEQCPLKK